MRALLCALPLIVALGACATDPGTGPQTTPPVATPPVTEVALPAGSSPVAASTATPASSEPEPPHLCPLVTSKRPAFVWADSDARPEKTPAYAAPADFAGRWIGRESCLVVEVRPNGRFRWMTARDGGELCVAEGTMTGEGAALRWWRQASEVAAYEDKATNSCSLTVPGLRQSGPPFAIAPAVLLPSADEIILGYRSPFPVMGVDQRKLVDAGKSGGHTQLIRLTRAGTPSDKPSDGEGSIGAGVSGGRFVIDTGEALGDLVVAEDKSASGMRAYTLRWANGATERGELGCIRRATQPGCAGYRFVPSGRAPRIMRHRPGGQFYLTTVATEAEVQKWDHDEDKGWVVYPVGML